MLHDLHDDVLVVGCVSQHLNKTFMLRNQFKSRCLKNGHCVEDLFVSCLIILWGSYWFWVPWRLMSALHNALVVRSGSWSWSRLCAVP